VAPHPLSSTEEFACTPQIADEKPPQFLGSLALCAKNGNAVDPTRQSPPVSSSNTAAQESMKASLKKLHV
jgi:hypothetical protein